MSGRFITLEGGEGVGKSTQARRLADALTERGLSVVSTREPGGSPGAEAIRSLLLDGDGDRWSMGAEALLFAAARADHLERTIQPALQAGHWVLCDRFLDSSRAYQGMAGELGDEAIMTMHRIGSGGLLPDRTLILDLPDAEAIARAQQRDRGDPDRIGGRAGDFHLKVNAAFRRFVQDDPDRVRLVDASGAAEAVTVRMIAALADLLP